MDTIDAVEDAGEGVEPIRVRYAMVNGEGSVVTLDTSGGYGREELETEILEAFIQNSFVQIPIVKHNDGAAALFLSVPNLALIEVHGG